MPIYAVARRIYAVATLIYAVAQTLPAVSITVYGVAASIYAVALSVYGVELRYLAVALLFPSGRIDEGPAQSTDPSTQVLAREFNVTIRPAANRALFLQRQDASDFRGRADDERAVGKVFSSRDQRAGANDAARSDHRAIEHNGAHSHQHFIPNRARVENRFVSDGHEFPGFDSKFIREVNDGAVLDIAARAKGDPMNIGAQDSLKPNATFLA
jgi:hypothetical protein